MQFFCIIESSFSLTVGLLSGAAISTDTPCRVDGIAAVDVWMERRVSGSSGQSSSRSSIVAFKRKTPKIEPCGLPPLTLLGVDNNEPTLTIITLSVRKVAISSSIGVEAPCLARAFKHS